MRYWQILLNEWKAKGNSGLTIPYIIGSQTFLSPLHEQQNIEELLIDIIKYADPPICIKYCVNIKSLILEVVDPNKNLQGNFPLFNNNDQARLFVLNFPGDLGSNCEEIIDSLTEKYQHYIEANKFSINDGNWGDYTLEEEEFIAQSFSLNKSK